jgi:hypothetical protein
MEIDNFLNGLAGASTIYNMYKSTTTKKSNLYQQSGNGPKSLQHHTWRVFKFFTKYEKARSTKDFIQDTKRG